MTIDKIMDSGYNVTVTLSPGDLKDMIEYVVSETKNNLEKRIQEEQMEVYLTSDQVSKMLDVDKSTLYRWRKRKYLVPIQIGGKVRYSRQDIINKMIKIEL